MRIGKTYRFEAAHHLPNHKGRCARPHGHSYKLEVEIAGTVSALGGSDGGMVLDFDVLDAEIVQPLLELLDHTDLNVSAMTHLQIARTTVELLAEGIAAWIDRRMTSFTCRLSRVRLWETEKCYAEWTP